jgi:hypothetical protein
MVVFGYPRVARGMPKAARECKFRRAVALEVAVSLEKLAET